MSLARAQADFLDAILAAAEPADAGLAVYHRNALAARRSALAAAYPVVRRLVGAAFLDEAAERYAHATPSLSGDLHAYGASFPRFLGGYAPARALDYLPDVARLEWAVHESSHAADAGEFDFAALGRVPPHVLGGVRIGLHPAVRLVASGHAVLAIWEANQEGRDGTPDRADGPDRVLVRRHGFAVAPAALDPPGWELAQALARGATLDEAAADLARGGHAFAPALAALGSLGAFGGFEPVPRA